MFALKLRLQPELPKNIPQIGISLFSIFFVLNSDIYSRHYRSVQFLTAIDRRAFETLFPTGSPEEKHPTLTFGMLTGLPETSARIQP